MKKAAVLVSAILIGVSLSAYAGPSVQLRLKQKGGSDFDAQVIQTYPDYAACDEARKEYVRRDPDPNHEYQCI